MSKPVSVIGADVTQVFNATFATEGHPNGSGCVSSIGVVLMAAKVVPALAMPLPQLDVVHDPPDGNGVAFCWMCVRICEAVNAGLTLSISETKPDT